MSRFVLFTLLATGICLSVTTPGLPSPNVKTLSDINLVVQNPSTLPNPGTQPLPPVNPRSNPNENRFLQPLPLPLPTTSPQPQPVTPPPTPSPSPEAPPVKISVQKIEVIGSTVFSQEQINRIIKPFEGREVSIEELRSVADKITQLYIEKGYLTSRAILIDQTITNGVVQIRVIEGSLERIEIEGLRRLQTSYLRDRILLAGATPLNTNRLEDQLRLLRTNPLFSNIEASLRPGTELGKSILIVRVTEAPSFRTVLSFDNYSPPSVGGERYGINLLYRNLTGMGDEIFIDFYRSITGGSNLGDLFYRIPLNARDGTLVLRASPSFYRITDEDFEQFDIHGNSQLYAVSFRQPVLRSTREELGLTIGFTFQNSENFLADDPFSFTIGAHKGRTRTRALNFEQDYIRRDTQGAFALRSQFSIGLDILDATTNPHPTPDGRYFSWLGQIQRVQRLNSDQLLILQADAQFTPNSLLPYQQFVIGGGQSVRGYRQNIRAGDNGFRLSIEDRITLQKNADSLPTLQIAPFVDLGYVWNAPGNPNLLPDQRFLAGIGLGLIWQPIPRLNLRLDYGYPLINLSDKGGSLQDQAFYFQLLYNPW